MSTHDTFTSIEVTSTARVHFSVDVMPTWVRRDGTLGHMFQPEWIKMTISWDENGAEVSRRVDISGSKLKADGAPGTRRALCPLYSLLSPPTPEWAQQWIEEHEHIGRPS